MNEDLPGGGRPAVGRQAYSDAAKPPVNLSLVMVIVSSAVDRIVVSHIVERVGFKVVACEAAEAEVLLRRTAPCLVVAEDATNEAERAALGLVAQARTRSASGVPLLVVLSRPGSVSATAPADGGADAVVTMPITPEKLAPVIRRLVERARTLVSF